MQEKLAFSYLFGMSCSGTVAQLRDSESLQKRKFCSVYTFLPSEPVWWEWREGRPFRSPIQRDRFQTKGNCRFVLVNGKVDPPSVPTKQAFNLFLEAQQAEIHVPSLGG